VKLGETQLIGSLILVIFGKNGVRGGLLGALAVSWSTSSRGRQRSAAPAARPAQATRQGCGRDVAAAAFDP